MDRAASHAEAVSDIASHCFEDNLLGLVLPRLQPLPKEGLLLVDLVPNRVLFLNRQGLWAGAPKLSPQIRLFLSALQQGKTSREAIVKHVWGYLYHPARHDALLYRLVVRTRHLLGEHGDVLVTLPEGGYGLFCQVRFYAAAAILTLTNQDPVVIRYDHTLTHRQRELLSLLATSGSISMDMLRQSMLASKATLNRD